jgi:hypothetical protein
MKRTTSAALLLTCLLLADAHLSAEAASPPTVGVRVSPAVAGALVDQSLAAGALRANVQRIARLYLESGRALRPQRTRRAMELAIREVELSLSTLATAAPLDIRWADTKQKREFRRAIGSVRELWAELKPVLTMPYDLSNTQLVYDASEQLYIYVSKLTFIFEDALDSETGYLVDVSGRLQAMSERIGKAAIHAIVSRKTGAMVDYATWKQEYIDGYRELVAASVNDDYQRRNLELGRIMWLLFDDIVTQATNSSDEKRILEISKCADGMWEIAAGSRSAYVALLRQSPGQAVLVARVRRIS